MRWPPPSTPRRLAAELAAVSPLADRVGGYLGRRGQYGPAAELLRRALALDERLGTDDAALYISHNNLGQALRQLGDLPGARAELTRAIELGEHALGPDHPDLMAPHSNLGEVLRELGDLPGARAELTRAIELGERTLGPTTPPSCCRTATSAGRCTGWGTCPRRGPS